MANSNFVVHNGLTIGPLTIDAATGDIVTTGNITITSSVSNEAVNTLSANIITAGSSSGNIAVTGNVIPSANITYALGSRTMMWKDVFVGPGTLYINGTPVLGASTTGTPTINMTASAGQNIAVATNGGGILQLDGGSAGGGYIQVKSPLQIAAGSNLTSSDGNAIQFSNQIGVDALTSHSANTNLSLSAQGTGKIAVNNSITGGGTVTIADTTVTTSSTTGALVVAGGVGVNGDLHISGNVYSNGILAVQTSQLSVNAPLVYLAASPSYPYSYEIGLYSHFIGGAANAYAHTGMVRDHADNTWKFFANCTSEPTTTVNWTDPNLYYDKVKTGDHIIANTTASTSTTTGALQVSGGAGIAGAVYAGSVNTGSGAITTTGTVSATTLTGTLSTAAQPNITSVGTLSGLTVSAAIVPNANASVNLGSSGAWWATIYGTAIHAQYADLAENYRGDKFYNPGTVVMFSGSAEVTLADADTTRVAGVVSTNPATLMNGGLNGANVVPLALTGRVPTMVIGPVKKGDLMVSAGFGYAKANNTPAIGTIIGKALEDFPIVGKGVIEVVVGRF